MSVDLTPPGTRGRKMPSGPLKGMFARLSVAAHHLGVGRRLDKQPVMLLTTRGTKSGELRTAPVMGFAQGDRRWLVVASAAGAAKHPAWFLNMARHPQNVWVEVEGNKLRVSPQSLQGAEREEAWREIVAKSPRYAGYEQKTDRQIPVVRLTAAS